jgi:ribosomal protein L12E/L44/L45/RPP1/RPP2
MAPVIGPFCPLLLSIIMGAFGGRNIIEVTRSNAAPKTAAAPSSGAKAEAKTEAKAEAKTDGDAKKDF